MNDRRPIMRLFNMRNRSVFKSKSLEATVERNTTNWHCLHVVLIQENETYTNPYYDRETGSLEEVT